MTEPMLPPATSDELDVGWGDDLAGERGDDRGDGGKDADDDERFLAERPPHHDRD